MLQSYRRRLGTEETWSILLVEDNVIDQKYACMLLTNQGHRVSLVANGAEAVDAIKLKAYYVVLMDLSMPVVDDVEATTTIRKCNKPEENEETAIPILVLTAHAILGDKER